MNCSLSSHFHWIHLFECCRFDDEEDEEDEEETGWFWSVWTQDVNLGVLWEKKYFIHPMRGRCRFHVTPVNIWCAPSPRLL